LISGRVRYMVTPDHPILVVTSSNLTQLC
jgi:hypothetical protein